MILDVADRRTPVYAADVLEVALSDLRLAWTISDYNDPTVTLPPAEYIRINIYEHLRAALFTCYYVNKSE